MRTIDGLLRQLTVANQLTLLRLAAVPVLALALANGSAGLALAVYIAAAITDRLDGIAARRLGQRTALGAFLDPAADKLMMLVTYVALAIPALDVMFHVPVWLALLVVARDTLIVLVSVGLYMAHQVSQFPPTTLGKWTTGWEMVTGGIFLIANVWHEVPLWLLQLAALSTGALVIASGLHYLVLTTRASSETSGPTRDSPE